MITKAEADDFLGRFREIVADPTNLAIKRDPYAGFVDGDNVYLHNGIRVPINGPYAYYGKFSEILIINRGVHEPLEEFVFQKTLNVIPSSPIMLELGAYWGHYSMWLKKHSPKAVVYLVEPELENLNAGKHNFELNGFAGEFIHAYVGKDQFEVDKFISDYEINKIDILHSDIQGCELEMLDGCVRALAAEKIDRVFISTHSQKLHLDVIERLKKFNYRIEVSSDFDSGTTSFDGFILASSRSVQTVFKGFIPFNRVQINNVQPGFLIEFLSKITKQF